MIPIDFEKGTAEFERLMEWLKYPTEGVCRVFWVFEAPGPTAVYEDGREVLTVDLTEKLKVGWRSLLKKPEGDAEEVA